jgi:YidC/Oxa1 family membrane protein insertase
MDTQKLILIIILSFSSFVLWDAWQKEQQPTKPLLAEKPQATEKLDTPDIFHQEKEQASLAEGLPEIQKNKVINITTDNFVVGINTLGGTIQHVELLKHKDAANKKQNVILLNESPADYYVAQSGLLGDGLPNHKSLFTADAASYQLTGKELVVKLHWKNPEGVKVDKLFVFHEGSYLVDIYFEIQNEGDKELHPSVYFQLVRTEKPATEESRFVKTFTGPAFYTEEAKFHKVSFEEIKKGKAELPKPSQDGWVAMLQHYFFTAWLPESGFLREFFVKNIGGGLYSVGVLLHEPVGNILPGKHVSIKASFYSGPQEQGSLAKIAKGLDLTVDYGWLTIIAAPLYWVLANVHAAVGNWGLAIVILTLLVKLMFFPLSAKSYRSMAHMRKVSPKLQKIKEQYGDDRQKMNEAMMALYKTEKINPLGGCLPVLIQIPVFIALYWVLLNSVEMRQAPFYGWITDLSAADPYYVLPALMGITMFVQSKLNPAPPDPIQAKVMTIMPIAMTAFFVFFPAGLVLYWVVNNLLSILQQWYITKRLENTVA